MATYTRTDVSFADGNALWNLDFGGTILNNIGLLFSLVVGGSITNPVLTLPDGANLTIQGTFTTSTSGLTITASGTVTGLSLTSGSQTIATLSGFSTPVSFSFNPLTNQTSVTAPTFGTDIFPGNDTLSGGIQNDTFFGFGGSDHINGGSGTNTLDYSTFTADGITANVVAGHGTVNKGAGNGVDSLTSIQIFNGSPGSDAFYFDANEKVAGGGGFDYLIELSGGPVTLTYGVNFTGISEIVSNTGNSVIDATGDASQIFIYGSTGIDTLTLGSGGGFLFSGGGAGNVLNGGFNGVNFLVDSGGTSTMNGGGGTAVNFFYVAGATADTVHGAGAFSAVIQLNAGVNVQLGSANFLNVNEYVANGGTNTVSVASTDSGFKYLYGGAGNDTLSTGAGGGYLIGEGGTNILNGGGGLNVFVADGGAGVDTMNGGTGNNVYFTDSNSKVNGAGTFNTVVELQSNVARVLGSGNFNNVQELVFNGGTNSADFSTAPGSVYLYGANGNDTLKGGLHNDYLWGGAGSNTFQFQQHWGNDFIMDPFAGTNEIIDLTALAGLGVHNINDITQSLIGGSDVITTIHDPGNSITVFGVPVALSSAFFHFA